MRSNTRICLIGPHAAGKTSLGHALSALLCVPFRSEVGAELRRVRRLTRPNEDALSPQPEFDRHVLEADLARDAGPPWGVVETWHPGNLAYARLRSPAVAAALERPLRRACARAGAVLVVPVVAPQSVLRARLSEPGPSPCTSLRFFARVAREAERAARDLGLPVLPAVDSSTGSPRVLAAWVVRAIERWQP